VLVAGAALKVGSTVHATDLRWQLWPLDGIDGSMVSRSATPEAIKDFENSLLRTSVAAGEPMRLDRVIRNPAGGVMAAMLMPGYRALAINIDNRGASSAGGFILPNDKVDVIRVTRDEMATRSQGGEVMLSETILRNVRVLAIGRNIQDPNGEKVSVGDTATLELTPRQVETVFLAQRTGQLTLALRSLQDTETTAVIDDAPRKVSVRYAGALAKQFNCSLTSCSEGR
jgi:pilus assembly protein CpaB